MVRCRLRLFIQPTPASFYRKVSLYINGNVTLVPYDFDGEVSHRRIPPFALGGVCLGVEYAEDL